MSLRLGHKAQTDAATMVKSRQNSQARTVLHHPWKRTYGQADDRSINRLPNLNEILLAITGLAGPCDPGGPSLAPPLVTGGRIPRIAWTERHHDGKRLTKDGENAEVALRRFGTNPDSTIRASGLYQKLGRQATGALRGDDRVMRFLRVAGSSDAKSFGQADTKTPT